MSKYLFARHSALKVNIQDFLQVFQGSGIGKIEDNLMSADPLSYTTTEIIPGRPSKLSQRLLTCKNSPHSFLWSPGPMWLFMRSWQICLMLWWSSNKMERGRSQTSGTHLRTSELLFDDKLCGDIISMTNHYANETGAKVGHPSIRAHFAVSSPYSF